MTVNLPEVNFLTTDANELAGDIIKQYEGATGRTLAQSDPLYLIFLSFASVITKQNVAINDAARQNLLYYARDNVLDHKGVEWRTPRLEATAATTTLRLYVSEPLTTSKIIEKGTVATTKAATVFFVSEKEYVLESGDEYVDIDMICAENGEIGNGFEVGEINTLVKHLPYISRVENITVSNGGTERESDDAYRERIYLAPETLSNAGSSGAYEYFAKKASTLINDVYVYMPEPGRVNISVLLKDGELPTEEIIDAVYETCNAKEVRPLTDFLTVEAPEIITYDLSITYYIETNSIDKNLIHNAVQKAIDKYIIWQSLKIGRDINPSRLISDCIKAGAKRVEVVSPQFVKVNPGQVAKIGTKVVTFGGIEDD